MRTIAFVLALASTASLADEGVRWETRVGRGWLTGAGLALAGAGAVALSFAAYQGAQSEAASRTVAAYYANGAAPTALEASTVRWLQERSEAAASQALMMLISGGAASLVGIGLVLIDGWLGRATVTAALSPSGGQVLLGGSF
jgi:hypothetical protein